MINDLSHNAAETHTGIVTFSGEYYTENTCTFTAAITTATDHNVVYRKVLSDSCDSF